MDGIQRIAPKTESSSDTLNGFMSPIFYFVPLFLVGPTFCVCFASFVRFQSIRCRRIWGEKCADDTLMKNEVVRPPGSKSLTQFSFLENSKKYKIHWLITLGRAERRLIS